MRCVVVILTCVFLGPMGSTGRGVTSPLLEREEESPPLRAVAVEQAWREGLSIKSIGAFPLQGAEWIGSQSPRHAARRLFKAQCCH
ncbi:unnamed protein product [Boreogadus saida]